MPFRFRKSFSLGGIRFNFGKKGLSSASVGKKGMRLTLGKNGIRPTVGIPGTGISYSPQLPKSQPVQQAKVGTRQTEPVTRPTKPTKPKIKLPFFVLPATGVIVMLCCGVFYGSSVIGAIFSTPTSAPTIDVVSIQSTANAKAWLPFTLTAAALPTNTATALPTITETSTSQPTSTLAPTFTPIPTATILNIQKLQPLPTQPPQSGVCSCSGDSLNCADFSSHSRAQACYDYCISVGAGDIHRLDKDGNGSACESLP